MSQISEFSGYNADTELDDNDIFNFVQNGIITETTLKEEPDDEVPPKDKVTADEDEVINTQASQAVDNLEIEIQEVEQLPSIDEEQSQQIDEDLELEEQPTIAITKPKRETKQPQLFLNELEGRKQPQKKKARIVVLPKDENFDTQQAQSYFIDETKSDITVSTNLIVENVRLETRKPDDQAKVIYGADFDKLKNSDCYLCGFPLSERISHKHNERWGYKHNPITSSYDHTAPVNFSFIVSRIPSQYNNNRLEDYEIPFLKSNGKFACFHCNFTKSQRMFITCPKGAGINFENFKHNDSAIKNFVNDLLKSKSDWSLGPRDENTLHECIKKYKGGDVNKWKSERIQSITNSAIEVCTMIKNHVDQKSVMKRLYYTKLLIEKANEILQTDQVYLAQPTTPKKNTYAKKFIAHFVAKAEGTNTKFIKPWKQESPPIYIPPKGVSSKPVTLPSGEKVIPTYIGNPIKLEEQIKQQKLKEQQKELQIERGEGQSLEPRSRSTSRIKSGSRRKRTRKSKRKTFRRKRLF